MADGDGHKLMSSPYGSQSTGQTSTMTDTAPNQAIDRPALRPPMSSFRLVKCLMFVGAIWLNAKLPHVNSASTVIPEMPDSPITVQVTNGLWVKERHNKRIYNTYLTQYYKFQLLNISVQADRHPLYWDNQPIRIASDSTKIGQPPTLTQIFDALNNVSDHNMLITYGVTNYLRTIARKNFLKYSTEDNTLLAGTVKMLERFALSQPIGHEYWETNNFKNRPYTMNSSSTTQYARRTTERQPWLPPLTRDPPRTSTVTSIPRV